MAENMTKELWAPFVSFPSLPAAPSLQQSFLLLKAMGLQLYILFPTRYLCETGGDSPSLYMQIISDAGLTEAPAT